MERKINKGNKYPKGRVGCDTASELLRKKKEREEKQRLTRENLKK